MSEINTEPSLLSNSMASKTSDPWTISFYEDLIKCSICFDAFISPKVLPCLHTFCQDCIHRHYEVYRLKNKGKLSCPSCRVMLALPVRGVPGFRCDVSVAKMKAKINILISHEIENIDAEESLSCDAMKEKTHLYFGQLQSTVAQLRIRILELYKLENQLRTSMDIQCGPVVKSGSKSSDVLRLKKEVTESHYPSIAQIASEQDCLYQIHSELKSASDILELLIDKAPNHFFTFRSPQIDIIIDEMKPFLEKSSPSDDFHGAVGGSKPSHHFHSAFPSSNAPFENGKCFSNLKLKTTPNNLNPRLLFKVTGRGSKPGQFDNPSHVSFLPDCGIMVCDKNNYRLQLFDNNGNFLEEFLPGEIKPRRARLSLHDGYIYISDELSECVKVYSTDGCLVRRIGPTFFQCPCGLDIDSKGFVILTDSEKCMVSVHHPDGEVFAKWYYRYLTDKLIPNPYFAVVNDDDQLIISDHRNNIIKVFSNSGTLLFEINDLNVPRGVAIDPYGNILVAQGDKHSVSMFNPYGKFVQDIVTRKDGIHFPLAIDFNKAGQLAVSQCGHYSPHEVLVFQVY